MEPINTARRGGKFSNAAKNIEVIEETPLRPQLREEDSRASAAKRAAQLREHLGDVVDGQDDFYIPLDEIPDGWTYEWKRHTIYGQEDPAYQIQLARSGWEPVSRFAPSVDDAESNSSAQTILRKGMILMQCPTEIIDERRAADLRKARMQVRAKEQQIAGTPDGTLTRDDARVRPQIKKSYEAMPIPEK